MPLILAYHGCDRASAQSLLGGSSFLSSNKNYDWLGQGAYFWESDPVRAYQWACRWRPKTPCVVGVALELGNCLDLTTQSGIRAVKAAYDSFVALQATRGQPVPQNKAAENTSPEDRVLRYLDRAVIDHLHAGYEAMSKATEGRVRSFDTVRALFPEGSVLYENAGFRLETHVQIAVRKVEQIQGTFRIPAHIREELNIPNIYEDLP